jgi:8-amino-7-oxononanoate synthase
MSDSAPRDKGTPHDPDPLPAAHHAVDNWLTTGLQKLEAQSLRREITERQGPQGREVRWDGRPYLNFGSNDYLGLAADPRLTSAAINAAQTDGWGSAASPLVSGRGHHQARLEEQLAKFERSDGALIFPSGYAANIGVLTGLADPQTHIYSDAKNHASIIDACRLTHANVHIYRHADMEDLESHLARFSPTSERHIIVTDGLFSMDGDLAPLVEISRLAETYQGWVVVDEAHATGVLGAHGRGACEYLGVDSPRLVRVGTLSKALGSIGGFLVGSQELVNWVANRARPYIFSTALPGPCLAAASAALQIVVEEPQRRRVLMDRAAWLRAELIKKGFRIGTTQSQIVPVIMGDAKSALAMGTALRSKGFYIPVIRPPSVPQGESLLRISLSYHHEMRDVEALVQELNS